MTAFKSYSPSQGTIRKVLEEIQATWTEDVRQKRKRGITKFQKEEEQHWTIPVVSTKYLGMDDRIGEIQGEQRDGRREEE